MIPTPPLPHLEQMLEPDWGEVLRLLTIISAIVLTIFFGGRFEAFVDGMGAQTSKPLPVGLLLLYAVLISAPFLRGVELVVAVLILFGAAGAPFVYMATIAGRVWPISWGGSLRPSGSRGGLPRSAWRSGRFTCRPKRIIRTRRRMKGSVASSAIIRLPNGFSAGGISCLAQCSVCLTTPSWVGERTSRFSWALTGRAYGPAFFAATILFAVAPVPLAVLVLGRAFLE